MTSLVKTKHFANAASMISAMQELASFANVPLSDIFVTVDEGEFRLTSEVRLLRNTLTDGSLTYDFVIAE